MRPTTVLSPGALLLFVLALSLAACTNTSGTGVVGDGGTGGDAPITYEPTEYEPETFRPLVQRIAISRVALDGAVAPTYPGLEARDGMLVTVGVVDWEAGTYVVPGAAPIRGTGVEALKARRAARTQAVANAVKLAGGLQLDEDRLLDVRSGEIELDAFVRDATFSDERTVGGRACITVTVPIHGVGGLMARVYDVEYAAYERTASAYTPAQQVALQGEVTDVVIDARQTRLEPGLLPKIVTENGEVVYDIQSPTSSAVKSAGMAEYAVCEEELGSLEDWLRRGALARTRGPRLRAGAQLAMASPLDVMLAQRRRRGKRKVRPVVVKNVDRGQKVDVIVSEEDAAKVKAADDQSGVLRNAKVIVVVGSQVAGKRGQRRVPCPVRVARADW